MKKLLFFCAVTLLLSLVSSPAFTQPIFRIDIDPGSKNFQDEVTITDGPGGEVTVDLYLRQCPQSFNSAGIMLTYDNTCVTISSANCAPGWLIPGQLINNPGGFTYLGPGSISHFEQTEIEMGQGFSFTLERTSHAGKSRKTILLNKTQREYSSK